MQHFTFEKNGEKITMRFFSLFSSERLRSLVSSYHLRIFVFSAFVVNLFYAVYNNKIYHFLNERAGGNSSFKIHILRNAGELAFVRFDVR